MSDHDPIDRAYAQSEALLADEAARAARRSRVLAAVALEAPAPAPRTYWRPARWMAGACAAGLALVFLTSTIIPNLTTSPREPKTVPPAPPQTSTPPPAAGVAREAPVTPPAGTIQPREELAYTEGLPPPPMRVTPSPVLPPVGQPVAPPAAGAPRAFPLAPAAAQPPAVSPPADVPSVNLRNLGSGRTLMTLNGRRMTDDANVSAGTVVTGGAQQNASSVPAEVLAQTELRASGNPTLEDVIRDLSEVGNVQSQSARGYNAGGYGVAPVQRAEVEARGAFDQTAALRTAAFAGRTAEIETLLARGVAIDAVDANGNTALMLAVQARRTAAAALLLSRGASLDRRNTAGQTPREAARLLADPELNKALGLAP